MIGYIIALGSLLGQSTYLPDLRSDRSTEVYIGPDYSLSDTSYEPEWLVPIPRSDALLPTKDMTLRIDALLSLSRMSQDMYREIELPLVLVSAYRSHSYQHYLIEEYGDGNLRAKPGHSEHQLGLAVDVMGLSNAHMEGDTDASRVYQWLTEHAHEYGWHQSYQNGLAIDGYYTEKWHRRYVGPILATILHQEDQTLTQYFYDMIRPIDPSTGDVGKNTPHIFSSRASKPVSKPSAPAAPPQTPIHREQNPIIDELHLHPL